MNTTGAYDNTVWRVELPVDISSQVVTNRNLLGSITNSDLEMVAILLQWLMLEQIAPTNHRSVLTCSSNKIACSRATHIFPRSKITTRLVRILALHQYICQAAPMATLHVDGQTNDIAGISSRFFRLRHRWNSLSDKKPYSLC